MKAFIYTGGSIRPENITERPGDDDIIIAADSGYLNAKKMGQTPHLLIGDFDSLGKMNVPERIRKMELPTEKDVTDTQAAVDIALENGADGIIIIGGLDGRLDHTLSNMALLRMLWEKGIYAVINDGSNRVRYIRSSSTLIARSGYKYLSLLCDDEQIKGVDVEGCKYPLKNARLYKVHQFAVSNEITGNCALISVKKGGMFIIESADR